MPITWTEHPCTKSQIQISLALTTQHLQPRFTYIHNGLALVYVYSGYAVRVSRKCHPISPTRVTISTRIPADTVLKTLNPRGTRRERATILPPRNRSRYQTKQYEVQPRAEATASSQWLPLTHQQRTSIRATPPHRHELPRSLRRRILLQLSRRAVQPSLPLRHGGVVL